MDQPAVFDFYVSAPIALWRDSLLEYRLKASLCDTCAEANVNGTELQRRERRKWYHTFVGERANWQLSLSSSRNEFSGFLKVLSMGLFQGFRRLSARGLRKIADRLSPTVSIYEQHGHQPFSADGWDHIPQNQYDYTPKGSHVSGPASRFLLVPKNRYKLVLLPDQQISTDQGIGWITEDNSAESYDRLWGSTEALDAFRAEAGHARDKLTVEIVDHIETRLPDQLNVIDVGCGAGDLLLEVKARRPAARVTGLDFSGKAIESARQAFPEGDFRQFVIHQTLPYADAQFDLVTCTDVLEHLEYPKLILAELVRICRPGGLVVVVVPDGEVDQFFGHYWFWNERSLHELAAQWHGQVSRLPETKEFILRIEMPGEKQP